MNSKTLSREKERLKQIIADFKIDRTVNVEEKLMLNRLSEIVSGIYIENMKEKAGLLTYLIVDSFNVENFHTEEFLNFDKMLKSL